MTHTAIHTGSRPTSNATSGRSQIRYCGLSTLLVTSTTAMHARHAWPKVSLPVRWRTYAAMHPAASTIGERAATTLAAGLTTLAELNECTRVPGEPRPDSIHNTVSGTDSLSTGR